MQTGEINILIVDDIEDNRLVLKTICKKFKDVSIFEAGNGLEAVEIVENGAIDIVLMDVMMPFMDGFEASKIIKSMQNPPYILIVTAVADKETETKFTKLGIDGYVRKPIERESFRARVEGLKNACLIKKGLNAGMATKKPLSKQAVTCRNFKTYFLIENEEDAMNLGLWITEYRTRVNADITFDFEDSLAATYKICEAATSKSESVTVVIEEDFENMYLTFIPSNSIDCSYVAEKLNDSATQNVLFESTIVYLTINLSSETKNKIEEQTAAPQIIKEAPKQKSSESAMAGLQKKGGKEKVSAFEFISEFGESPIIDEIYDLSEIEGRWKACLVELSRQTTKANLNLLVDSAIDEYARVINKISEFSSLGYAITSLCGFLKQTDEKRLDEIALKLYTLLEATLNNLMDWRHTIFIAKNTKDIHFLDNSIIALCIQIDALAGENKQYSI